MCSTSHTRIEVMAKGPDPTTRLVYILYIIIIIIDTSANISANISAIKIKNPSIFPAHEISRMRNLYCFYKGVSYFVFHFSHILVEVQIPSRVSKTWPKVQTPTTRLWTSWRKISRAPCAAATTRRPRCSPAITTTVGRVSSREGGPSPTRSAARTRLFPRAASSSCRARSSWRG